jgi:hypothetical protein
MRQASKKHAWFVDLVGGRPHLGPNALAHLEASLAALHVAPGFEDIDDVMQAVGTVNAFVVGAIRGEAVDLHAELASGMDKRAWQDATWPYMQRMLAQGELPTIAKVVRDAKHPPPDVAFERGLDCVIEGIAAKLVR